MATGLENLKIYQIAEGLEIGVHDLTKEFPKDEQYRSVDQLRRSSASVSNNIAESYGRYSHQEKIRMLIIARGEAEETKRNIIRSYKKDFISEEVANNFANEYTELLKGINGYIRFLRNQKNQLTI
ncbi:MAG: hypothetical protein UT66_C0009G0020 [candidate division CPR2 bacterium GW2011_GWC1_39_9]|uniref:S23 ribosomal protein n=1 Tax=candidate division CPR2 bacterium GW2011_GWC2_39_10 TaxID=1618345 RepID=A0A0G0LT04_UNCC2|nr:MAG: hypothetical protein UT18_C0004G0025 [candidate division CPR2 bacterium GW2011_GWC2_39_10]KKR35657.1 MAG: hypothetical protein UT66_C0009G0020 [candidate division CPR2 bacterium GW2011_GWC1_39_9]